MNIINTVLEIDLG